jgi:Ca2+-binding EF-hand superfamily protein
MLKKLDTDGDGRVSRAEFQAGKQAKFDKMDNNNDGVVTTDKETAKAEKKHWWSRSDKSNDKVVKADTNADGQVTASEQSATADAWFTKADTNNDGYLSASELQAAHDMK